MGQPALPLGRRVGYTQLWPSMLALSSRPGQASLAAHRAFLAMRLIPLFLIAKPRLYTRLAL